MAGVNSFKSILIQIPFESILCPTQIPHKNVILFVYVIFYLVFYNRIWMLKSIFYGGPYST